MRTSRCCCVARSLKPNACRRQRPFRSAGVRRRERRGTDRRPEHDARDLMMVSVTPHLNTGRVVLRPFTAGDVIGRQRLGRDPEIIRMFGGTPEFSEPVAM